MTRVTTQTASGSVDHISRSARAVGLSFKSSATPKPFTTEVVSKAADGSQRRLMLTVASSAEGDDIAFDSRRDSVQFVHRGAAGTYQFSLQWAGIRGAPSSFASEPLHVRRGDRITITPRSWTQLALRPVSVKVTTAAGKTQTTVLPVKVPMNNVKIVQVSLQESPQGRRINVESIVARKPAEKDVLFTSWNILRNGRSIERHVQQAPPNSVGEGARTDFWVIPREVRGTVVLVASVVLIHPGDLLESETAVKSQAFRMN